MINSENERIVHIQILIFKMSDAGDLKPTNNPEGQAEIPGAYQQAPYQQPPIAQPGYPVNQ